MPRLSCLWNWHLSNRYQCCVKWVFYLRSPSRAMAYMQLRQQLIEQLLHRRLAEAEGETPQVPRAAQLVERTLDIDPRLSTDPAVRSIDHYGSTQPSERH